MINYTRTAEEASKFLINSKIQEDLNYISEQVRTLLGETLHSILLCGGFGRGEGSVVVENGEVHIVNDYDLTIVLNARNRLHYLALYKKCHGPLEDLARQLAHRLHIKQVDLSPKPISYFTKKQPLKIENYEVKTGHVLLHGDHDPTRHMPDWQPEDIPLFEGTWLFRNRGTGLLLAALYFMSTGQVDMSKRENFIIECNKAILAMGDAILLMKRRYHHQYAERGDIIKSLDLTDIPEGEALREKYLEALDMKLHPDFKKYDTADLVKWWFDVTGYVDRFFFFFERKRLSEDFRDWCAYADMKKPEDRAEVKTLVVKFLKTGRSGLNADNMLDIWRKSKKSFTVSLVSLLLFSVHEDGFDTHMMEKAAAMLNINLSGAVEEDWLFLAKSVLREIHPGGEVGSYLADIKTRCQVERHRSPASQTDSLGVGPAGD